MGKWFSFLGVVALAFFVSGCATITTSRFQNVPVNSDPQGADVVISSGSKGVTPCTFNLQRNKEHIVTISKNGYKTAELRMEKSICWSTAWNILMSGPIGLGVDTLTGAVCKIIPKKLHVELVPENQTGMIAP